ncbi:MAG: SDR family NAD(P)-dependent oxidoreductase [Acidimicrobiia bacterium]|nr:SDR family NAD(P)-dependent oxidoreductase [Acidimicrobiia bacterium]
MERIEGRVVVVTGAASGIGRAIAQRFAADGARIVLADVERPALERAQAEMTAAGATTLAVPTDVADAESVASLASQVADRWGGAHVVCANAGVGSRGLPIAELPIADFQWLLGVNLFGVINTVQAFLDQLEAADEAHLVTTASIAALMHPQGMGPYNASKAAVLALTETLRFELAERAPHVGVSVLCPGWVRTNLGSADRNRPESLAWEMTGAQAAQVAARRAFVAEIFARGGIEPAEVADIVAEGVRTNRFYLFTHPDMTAEVDARFRRIVDGQAPLPPVL